MVDQNSMNAQPRSERAVKSLKVWEGGKLLRIFLFVLGRAHQCSTFGILLLQRFSVGVGLAVEFSCIFTSVLNLDFYFS